MQTMEENTNKTTKRSTRSIFLTVLLVLAATTGVALMTCYQVTQAGAHARYMGIKNVSSEKIATIIR